MEDSAILTTHFSTNTVTVHVLPSLCVVGQLKYCKSFEWNFLSSSLLSKNLRIKIYRTIILPVVLYGCKTWSLTSREEGRLRVFENRAIRRISGPKRDEVTGEWRKLHEELNDLCCSPNNIREE